MLGRPLLSLSLALLIAAFALPARADFNLTKYRVGALLGYSKLSGDPALDKADAFAYGLTLGTLVTPSLGVNLDIVGTTHPNNDHREVSLGVDYNFLSEDDLSFDPRLTFGVTRVSNTLKTYDISGSTFGVYLGVGVDWRGWQGWRPGLEIRYNKVIPTEINRITGQHLTTVDDNVNVLFRLLYEFDEFGWE